jgi:uncharacterized protein YggE
MPHNVAMATTKHLTPAERMAATRARREAAGIKEVRGIHAHTDDHPAVRDEANKHAAKLAKARARKLAPAKPKP